MKLMRDYFREGDTTKAFQYASVLKFKEFEKGNREDRNAFDNFKMTIAGELAISGKHGESLKMAQRFSNRKNRVTAFSKLASICQINQKFDDAKMYFDSANAEMKRLKDFRSNGWDFRMPIIEMLALQNTRESNSQALRYIGSMEWGNRSNGVLAMVRSYARIGEYKKAKEIIPALASSDDLLNFYRIILIRENLNQKNDSGDWERFYKNRRGYSWTFFQNDLIEE
jgi:uncharacterized protein HemY